MRLTDAIARWLARQFHVSQEPPGWFVANWGQKTHAGVDVNPDTALNYAAVFACVRILSETIASLPLPVYERLTGGGKERARGHYLYRILHDAPNPLMTSMEFREALQGHVLLRGNAYAEIEYDGSGSVAALWPLRPDRMRVEVARDWSWVRYIYRLPNGETHVLTPDRVLHLRGFGNDGLVGYSTVTLARQSIGLGLATEEFGSRFFGDGARPSAVLIHPRIISEEARKRMAASWHEEHGGLPRSHRIAILEEGVAYQQVGISPEDSQFLETRKFQVTEVARWFRIPPHLLADLERATFSNIEEQGLEFVIYTLMPWLVRWEQRLTASLLTPAERQRYFIEHLVAGLLRGDMQKRYQAYATARQWGWLSADDIRELENMNPLPDGAGKTYLIPLNMVPAGGGGNGNGGEAGARSLPLLAGGRARGSGGVQNRRRLARSYRRLYTDALARILRRERNDLVAAAKKFLGRRDLGQFAVWLEEFYQEHASFIRAHLDPVAYVYGQEAAASAQEEINLEPSMTAELERFMNAYMVEYAGRHIAGSKSRIQKIVQRALADGNLDVETEFEAELETWPEARADEIAASESVRFGSAVAVTAWSIAGVQRIRWVAFGKNCPYCANMDGRVIGISQYFLAAGEEFNPEGADGPLISDGNHRHPPLHRGCDCSIAAEM